MQTTTSVPDLKQFRISTTEELNKCRQDKGTFYNYYLATKEVLDNWPYGRKFNILEQIPEKNHKIFIKAACLYMLNQAVDEVEFTNDYLFIRKRRFI